MVRPDRRMALWVFSIAAFMSGCAWLEPVPAYQIDLSATEWVIVAIDGKPIAGDAYVKFVGGGETASIQTACRVATTTYAWDTDGAALGIGPVPPTPETCLGEAAGQDGEITAAIEAAESWRVVDEDEIHLLGDREITLARPAES